MPSYIADIRTRYHIARRRSLRRTISLLSPVLSLGLTLAACHDLVGNQALPSGTKDPSYYNNATGALGMRNNALIDVSTVLPSYIVATGLLTDELENPSFLSNSAGASVANAGLVYDPLDERLLPAMSYGSTGSYASDMVYNQLQGTRGALLQAIGQLATYDTTAQDVAILKPAVGRALRGELYALYGYTEIMLADFFCSGIPLSTFDFQHDYTYRAGSPRDSVYKDAIAHLDTALALSVDSVRFHDLALIGLGRAYLDLGQFAAAADDVSGVPDIYQYQLSGAWVALNQSCVTNGCNLIDASAIVSNREGRNGLPFLTTADPRTADTTIMIFYQVNVGGRISGSTIAAGYPRVYLAGLTGTQYAPITIASGTEARLIQAEAALQSGNVNGWLNTLNTLRATAPIPGQPILPDSLVDTLGVTGCGPDQDHWCLDDGISGGYFQVPANYSLAHSYEIKPVPSSLGDDCWNNSYYPSCYDSIAVNVYRLHTTSSLSPLTDPGTDSARIALTFQERAAWLYLTGHRQGDLRRQVRQYARYWPDQSHVYPTGTYLGVGGGTYGNDVTAPIPPNEYLNPLFHGCLNRAP